MKENPFDRSVLEKKLFAIKDYGIRRLCSVKIKKLAKQNKPFFMQRVNTPEGIPALYVYRLVDAKKHHYFNSSYMIIEDKVYGGESYVFLGVDAVFTIHYHAIKRYYERHGFNGSMEECIAFVLESLKDFCIEEDEYTDDFSIYFDDGLFLGTVKDDVYRIRTYINEKECRKHDNQRLQLRTMKDDTIEHIKESANSNNNIAKIYNSLDYYDRIIGKASISPQTAQKMFEEAMAKEESKVFINKQAIQ